jgi:hypothetical protein
LAFLDDEQELGSARGGPPRGLAPADRQQLMVRRAVALGVGLLFLILVIWGIKGCLDARTERAYKDYVRSVQSLTSESGQISKNLFSSLENPKNVTPLDFQSDVNSNRGAADVLVSRVKKLDPPDKMKPAQGPLLMSFELRRDALRSIADDLDTALGREGRTQAVTRIAGQMQALLASDVLYSQRAFPAIQTALREESIAGVQAPLSRFLPDIDWLTTTRVSEALARVRAKTGSREATPGVHGLGLVRVLATPGDVELNSAAPNSVRRGRLPGLKIEVQNQGESDETDAVVTVEVSGGNRPIDLQRTIARIAANETRTVAIPLSPAPPAGREVRITVSVEPVPGEKVTDNNNATYSVTFG